MDKGKRQRNWFSPETSTVIRAAHSPIPPYAIRRERGTFLILAACICGENCALSAAVPIDQFFTSEGVQAGA